MRGGAIGRRLWSPAGATAGACAAALGCVIAAVVPTHVEQSPTRDEFTHLTRGVAALSTGDTRLSVNHPPLANMVAALPAVIDGPVAAIAGLEGWDTSDVIAVTRAYAAADYARVRGQWLAGRAMMLVFPALLIVGLAVFVHRRVGAWAAAGTALLLATHPTLLAHATLTTTDVPVVTFMVLATCALARTLATPSATTGSGWRPLAALTLATGLAAASKFSGAYMAVVAVAALGVFAARGRGRYVGAPARRLGRWAVDAAALGVGVVLCIDAAYLFDRTGWTVGAVIDEPMPAVIRVDDLSPGYLGRATVLGSLPRWLPVPLPYTYVFGAEMLRRQTQEGRGTWFLGKITDDAGPRYFPMLLVLKSPLAFVIAFAGGLLLVIGRRRGLRGAGDVAVIGAVGGLFLAAAMTSRMTIGVRHVLVCLPVMAVIAGAGIEVLARTRGRWVAGLALAAAVVPSAVATLATRPDFLGYFNALTGDDAAERHISVIGEDWGQDTRALGRLALARGWQPLYYYPPGHTSIPELELIGVDVRSMHHCQPPRTGGWVAVHDGTAIALKVCRFWLRREPTLWLNNHVRIYELPPPGG